PHLMLPRNIDAYPGPRTRDRSACHRRPGLLTVRSTSATLSKLHPKLHRKVAAGRSCPAVSGGHRGWNRQHYHHADRRRDRRLAGRANRARFWLRTPLEHRHRHRGRLHRRLAVQAIGVRAVRRFRRLDRQRHHRRGHTFGHCRVHQTLVRGHLRLASRPKLGTMKARQASLSAPARHTGRVPRSREAARPSTSTRWLESTTPLRAAWEYAALHKRQVQRGGTMSEPSDGASRERDKPWIFRTYAGHSTARDSNA